MSNLPPPTPGGAAFPARAADHGVQPAAADQRAGAEEEVEAPLRHHRRRGGRRRRPRRRRPPRVRGRRRRRQGGHEVGQRGDRGCHRRRRARLEHACRPAGGVSVRRPRRARRRRAQGLRRRWRGRRRRPGTRHAIDQKEDPPLLQCSTATDDLSLGFGVVTAAQPPTGLQDYINRSLTEATAKFEDTTSFRGGTLLPFCTEPKEGSDVNSRCAPRSGTTSSCSRGSSPVATAVPPTSPRRG